MLRCRLMRFMMRISLWKSSHSSGALRRIAFSARTYCASAKKQVKAQAKAPSEAQARAKPQAQVQAQTKAQAKLTLKVEAVRARQQSGSCGRSHLARLPVGR